MGFITYRITTKRNKSYLTPEHGNQGSLLNGVTDGVVKVRE